MRATNTPESTNFKSFGRPPLPGETTKSQENDASQEVDTKEEAPVVDVQKLKTPQDMLSDIGADFSDDDFQKLLFKGYYEAVVTVIPERLYAKMRTLTAEEHDEIDSILATEIKDIPMTNDGYSNRHSALILAYGVLEVGQNKKTLAPLARPPVGAKAKSLDAKSLAMLRRDAIKKMAGSVVSLLTVRHGTMAMAINAICANPGDNLKNS